MASKRRIRRKACDGKIRHACREDAHSAKHSLAKKQGRDAGLGVYQCKHCKGWHLGHARGSRMLIQNEMAVRVLYHD